MTIRTGSLKIESKMAGIVDVTRNDGSVQTDDFSAIGRSSFLPSDANLLFHQKYAISASGSQTLDLSGSLEDALGQACVFSKVYAIAVYNHNTVAGDAVDVGGSNFAAFLGDASDTVTVGPKGAFHLSSPVDGYTVTATSADIFTVANGGSNTVNVTIVIIGKS